eukprot:2720613-Amphidinium_carterae.6
MSKTCAYVRFPSNEGCYRARHLRLAKSGNCEQDIELAMRSLCRHVVEQTQGTVEAVGTEALCIA